MLTYEEYSDRAWATAVYPNRGNNLFYPVLGIIGEAGELYLAKNQEDILREAGDALWYINAICREIQMPLRKIAESAPLIYSLDFKLEFLVGATKLAEIAKKIMRDDGGNLRSAKKHAIVRQLGKQYAYWLGIVGSDFQSVTQANLDKLESRLNRGVIQGSGDYR